MTAIREVVRVATTNNFNCTKQEFLQLDGFVEKYPDRYFFINSNIKTDRLTAINDHLYKAVITLNPDIAIDPTLVNKLYELDASKVAFVRVKYIPGHQEILDLINHLRDDGYKVVITMQRFNGKKSISQYVPDYQQHYKFSDTRYRLTPTAQARLVRRAGSKGRVFICDKAGLGCQGCGLCSKLTLGKTVKITSLNLSSSGICKFNCPDCYAKTMQHFSKCLKLSPISFDIIKANKKQAGTLKHIRDKQL